MTNPKRKKNASGKPEKSTERTLAQAQMDSRRALADRGGKLLHVRLEAEALSALEDLKILMDFRYDREAIAYALLASGKSVKSQKVA